MIDQWDRAGFCGRIPGRTESFMVLRDFAPRRAENIAKLDVEHLTDATAKLTIHAEQAVTGDIVGLRSNLGKNGACVKAIRRIGAAVVGEERSQCKCFESHASTSLRRRDPDHRLPP